MCAKKIIYEKIKENKEDILLLGLLLIISLYFRLWNLSEEHLLYGEEISIYYKFKNISILKFLTGNDFITSFFPFFILLKPFFFVSSLPQYLYVSSFLSVFSVIFTYLTVKCITNRSGIAFFMALLVSVNWVILMFSRVFKMDVLDAVFPAIVLYLYFKWIKTKKNTYIFLIFFILAISINNHAASIYFVLSTQIWFLYLIFRHVIKFKTYWIALSIFLITMLPYLNVLILSRISAARTLSDIQSAFSISYHEFLVFLWQKYNTESGLTFTRPYLVNLTHPYHFVLNLSKLFVPYPIDNLLYFLIIFLILITPIGFFYKMKNRDENIRFLIYQIFAVFLITFFSIVPINGPTYFFGFFVTFVCLLAKELTFENKLIRITIIVIFTILFLTNVSSSISRINVKSYSLLEQIWPKNITRLIVDGLTYESLKYVTNFKPFSAKNLYIFECRYDGIHSLSSDKIEYYNYENSTAKLDSDFFIKLNLTKNDIIIFSVECINNSRIHGLLNATAFNDLNNTYTGITVPMDFIGLVEGIIIYKIV